MVVKVGKTNCLLVFHTKQAMFKPQMAKNGLLFPKTVYEHR